MISLHKHSISAKIVDRYASIVYSFHFKNGYNYNNTSKELSFEITIAPESFISNFTAIIDNEVFNGITKEKQTASKEYTTAKQKNENAILITQPYKDIPNLFQINTNIDSDSEVSLQITIEQYLTKRFNFNEINIQILRSFNKYNIIKKYEYITFTMSIQDASGIFDIQIPSSATSKSNTTSCVDTGNSRSIIIDENVKDNTQCTIYGRIHSDKSSINELTLKYKIKGEQTDSMMLFDKKSNTFCHIISDIITDSMINNTSHHEGNHDKIKSDTLIPRRVVFVIDKSGSMSGSKWNKTVSATILALKQLRKSHDRFCVILFDNNMNVFPDNKIMPTNKKNVDNTIKWLQSKNAGGGTNINMPLLKAVEFIKKDAKLWSRVNYFMNQIFFITDGEVSNTDKIIKNVKQANNLTDIDQYSSNISIFSFGISSDNNDSSWLNDVNHSFLKSLSVNNNGIYKRIKHSNTDKTLNEFFNILSKPILSKVNVKYHNKNVTNLTQTTFNTLYSGNDLIICGQINLDKTVTHELDITATISAITCNHTNNITKPINIFKTIKMSIDTNAVRNNHNIEKIWAYLKLKQLADQKLIHNDMIEIDDDEKKSNDSLPLSLALKHSFVTPWTSMIVVKKKAKTDVKPIAEQIIRKKIEQYKYKHIIRQRTESRHLTFSQEHLGIPSPVMHCHRRISTPNCNLYRSFDRQLSENESLSLSLSSVTETLSMVADIESGLAIQDRMRFNLSNSLGTLTNKFPQANKLLLKIRKHKYKDSIILAFVCVVCLTLILIYWLNK